VESIFGKVAQSISALSIDKNAINKTNIVNTYAEYN